MIPVTLYIVVRPHGSASTSFRKPVELPIPPAVGMVLVNAVPHPDEDHEDECTIEQVEIDMESGEVAVILETRDYREVGGVEGITIGTLTGTPWFYYWGWEMED